MRIRETIRIFLMYLGMFLIASSIFWWVRDLWIADANKWVWFTRLVSGAVILGFSALIKTKEEE